MRLALTCLLIAALFAGCSDDSDDESAPTRGPATATVTATSAPESTETPTTLPSPTAPAIAVPTPSASPTRTGADTAPQGTETGEPSLDTIIVAILSRNRATLETLFQFTSAACTDDPGLGGPPKCEYAPGSPPPGTLVEALPTASCEGAWAYDLGPLIDNLVVGKSELYAVISLPPYEAVDGRPQVEYQLVFSYDDARYETGPLTRVFGVADGRVRSQASLCLAPPSRRLEQLEPGEKIILYGPAFP